MNSKRKDIIADIIAYITDNTIEFDTNPYRLCFLNKVFDLETNKFIEPKPEYYLRQTTNWNYDDNYDKKYTEELKTLIKTILTDPQVEDYYLSALATGMSGIQMENLFVATGRGGNGKSLLNSLMMLMLGDYAYKLPASLLTSPIKIGACPEINNTLVPGDP